MLQEAFQQRGRIHNHQLTTTKGLENADSGRLVQRTGPKKAKTKTNETKPTLQEAFQQRGTSHSHQLTTTDHHEGKSSVARGKR
jgi:hypothetical protein